jgi:hypothetical protein
MIHIDHGMPGALVLARLNVNAGSPRREAQGVTGVARGRADMMRLYQEVPDTLAQKDSKHLPPLSPPLYSRGSIILARLNVNAGFSRHEAQGMIEIA